MNLIHDHETFLVLSEIEFWIRQFRPVRRQFQVKVDGAFLQLGSQRKGQRGFADLARPEKPNRGESSQEVLNNWLDRSLNHYLEIMPCHSIIARLIRDGFLPVLLSPQLRLLGILRASIISLEFA